MTNVARIELYHVATPLPAWVYPAWIPGLPQTKNRFDLVRIVTDDGIEGISAAPAMGRERAGLGELLGPYLLGEDATDIDLIQQRLREMSYLGWRNGWLEAAFWDIKGKMANKPVFELLGGKAAPIRLYASTAELRDGSGRVDEAEQRYQEGFRTIKIRVHDFAETDDIAQTTEVVKAMGERMRVAVDANQGWRVSAVSDAPLWDPGRARRFTEVCADLGVAWLEEPLAMDAYEELSALTAHSRIPIAGGELQPGGLAELQMMIERRCYTIFQPDAIFTGGISQTMQVARLCRRHDLSYTPHTWTNGIGFAVNLHVFLASGFAEEREMEYPLAPPGWTVEARDALLTEPFVHDHGTLAPPTKPGLGINIDRRALRRYGRRYFVMNRRRLVWHALRDRGLRAAREVDRARRQRRKAHR